MNAATSFSPTALQIFELFSHLPELERESVRAKLASEDAEAHEVPAWQWEVLAERDKLRAAGLDQPVPWEDAKRELRQKWAAQ